MTESEWKRICSSVTDRMLEYVRPFVVPLSKETETDVRLIGTGTFVRKDCNGVILSCEHVAQEEPLNFRPYGCENVYLHKNKWTSLVEPIDAAWTDGALSSLTPPPKIVEPHQLAPRHIISCQEELLFFYGYSGENSTYGFDVHETNGTGYLTQQKRDVEPKQDEIELLWPNGSHEWSTGTSQEAQNRMKFSDPAGFSGSLVWNTRFLETGGNLDRWSPDQALVTGLLKRFVMEDKILLASPIEVITKVSSFT